MTQLTTAVYMTNQLDIICYGLKCSVSALCEYNHWRNNL